MLTLFIYALVLFAALFISGFILSLFGFESVKLSPELRKEIKKGSWYRPKDEVVARPLIFTRPLYPVNHFLLLKVFREKIELKLAMAELNLLPEDYLGIKELFTLALFFVAFFITKQIKPMDILVVILLGFFFPDLYLKRKIQRRKQLILKALPTAIDLISLCVGGGLEFMVGVSWVVARYPTNPLIKEFSRIIHDVKMGMSRQDALKDMAKRVEVPEISSFVNALVHAHRMGTPIADVLNILAEEARRQRFQRGERKALTAPIKMLFPLIAFIMPVVAIIVAGPILLQFFKGGLPKF